MEMARLGIASVGHCCSASLTTHRLSSLATRLPSAKRTVSPCDMSHLHQIGSDSRKQHRHRKSWSFIRVEAGSPGIVDQNERLKDAAKAGDLLTVNEILGFSEVGIDLPSGSRAGWTALHLASFYGHPSIVESLLRAGADLEVRNQSGNTPLQLASLKGNVGIARILLESGADLYAESSDKGTALDYAQEWGGEEMVDFLLLWAAKSNLNL